MLSATIFWFWDDKPTWTWVLVPLFVMGITVVANASFIALARSSAPKSTDMGNLEQTM